RRFAWRLRRPYQCVRRPCSGSILTSSWGNASVSRRLLSPSYDSRGLSKTLGPLTTTLSRWERENEGDSDDGGFAAQWHSCPRLYCSVGWPLCDHDAGRLRCRGD